MIESVLNAISLNAVVNPNIEVTLEANPSSVDRDKLRCFAILADYIKLYYLLFAVYSAFKAAGVNRLSLGVQVSLSRLSGHISVCAMIFYRDVKTHGKDYCTYKSSQTAV